MEKVKVLTKKFLDNPKFSIVVAVVQAFFLVVSYLAYQSFDEFWGMTHALGEGPVELSTLTWIISIAYYLTLGVLPHIVLALLQLNYLIKYIRKTKKSFFAVIGWLVLIGILTIIMGFIFSVGLIYVHDVFFRYS